jgi:hypothetical protein
LKTPLDAELDGEQLSSLDLTPDFEVDNFKMASEVSHGFESIESTFHSHFGGHFEVINLGWPTPLGRNKKWIATAHLSDYLGSSGVI